MAKKIKPIEDLNLVVKEDCLELVLPGGLAGDDNPGF